MSLNQDYSITPTRIVQRNQPIKLLWVGQDFNNSNIQLSPFQTNLYTRYPLTKDKQAQKFASELFKQSQSDPTQYVQQVIDWYQKQGFKYSLKPGYLGENRVDEFLFKSKEGFCEHYASSFVMLMRYVGIPARVVVGYQGGQAAPDQKSWEVRQLDAHAWTEVLINQSWVRVDPTAIIAPQRLDQGMQNYLSNDQSVFGDEEFSSFKYHQFNMIKQLRIWSDYASFQWQDKVIGFDSEKQKNWLTKLGFNSSYAYGLLIIGSILLIGVIYIIFIRWKNLNQQSYIQRILTQFNQQLSSEDQRRSGETFKTWICRLSKDLDSISSNNQLIQLHHQIVYLDQIDKVKLNEFRKQLNDYAITLKNQKKACQKK